MKSTHDTSITLVAIGAIVLSVVVLLTAAGCASSPTQPRQVRKPDTDKPVKAAVPDLRIISMTPLDWSPIQHLTGYDSVGVGTLLKAASNQCQQVRISYTSPVTCALYYNHQPVATRIDYVTGGCFLVAGWLRISGQLPAGLNTVTLPLSRGDTGFLTLRPF